MEMMEAGVALTLLVQEVSKLLDKALIELPYAMGSVGSNGLHK